MYTTFTDIATSAAVIELRLIFAIIALAMLLVGTHCVCLAFFFLADSTSNVSIESVVAGYGAILWVILIEFLLFLGICTTTLLFLGSLSNLLFCE
jgi:hypothetical protein